jgi:signal recognition particle GTPase
MDGGFTLDDFMSQMEQVQKLGPVGKVMGMIPGMSDLTKKLGTGAGDVEKQMARMTAVYRSMSRGERENTGLLDAQRRRRIARGAGLATTEVSQFIKQFEMSRDMMHAVGGSWRSAAGPSRVLGLVTDNPTRRDPSYVHKPPARPSIQDLPWKLFACVALAALVAALLLSRFVR